MSAPAQHRACPTKTREYKTETLRIGNEILFALRLAGRPLGPTELANRIGCQKNKAFRLAQQHVADGMLTALPDGTYAPGPAQLDLARDAIRHHVDAARAQMRRALDWLDEADTEYCAFLERARRGDSSE